MSVQPRSDLQAPHTRIFCFLVQRSASRSHQALHVSTAHCLWSLQAAQQSRSWLLLAPWQKSVLGFVRPQRLQSVGFRIASHILQCSFGLVALCSKSPAGFVVPQPMHSDFLLHAGTASPHPLVVRVVIVLIRVFLFPAFHASLCLRSCLRWGLTVFAEPLLLLAERYIAWPRCSAARTCAVRVPACSHVTSIRTSICVGS